METYLHRPRDRLSHFRLCLYPTASSLIVVMIHPAAYFLDSGEFWHKGKLKSSFFTVSLGVIQQQAWLTKTQMQKKTCYRHERWSIVTIVLIYKILGILNREILNDKKWVNEIPLQTVCNYLMGCVSGTFGKNKGKWGKEITSKALAGVKAHQQLCILPPPAKRAGRGKMAFWYYGWGETYKHRSLIKYTHFFRQYVLTEKFNIQKAPFSATDRVMERMISQGNKDGKWDRCELGSESPHQPCGCCSDTPGMPTHIWRELSLGPIQCQE